MSIDRTNTETEVTQSETIVLFGDAVKALGDGKIGGYLVRYGNPEQTDISPMRDYFTAETDFDIEDGAKSTVYYQHGLDPVLKRRKLGTATLKRDEFGVWAEAQLDVRDKYEQFIYQMAENGKMGWSSGVPSHLVEREQVGTAHHIKHWPLGKDASLTPTPAEPRNAALPLKSLTINPLELPEDEPEALTPETADAVVDAVSETASTVVEVEIVSSYEEGENAMSELNQNTPPVDERIESVENGMKSLSDKLDSILTRLEATPQSKNPGYFTVDGGTADPNVKSFGDFLLAIKRGDEKRLASVYNSTKAQSEDQGASGGYLVPDEFNTTLLNVANTESRIVGAVQKMPAGSARGKFPVLDTFVTPTAGSGNTAFAGGLTSSTLAENGSYNEANIYFEQLEYAVNKIGDKVEVSDELIEDAPIIEPLITRLVGVAVGSKKERHILRGSGVGEPLGILNSPAAIGVTPDTNSTFAYLDAAEMESRFHLTPGGRPFWLMHRSLKTDLASMQVSAGGASYVMNLNNGTLDMPLLNYPIIFSEHMPQADASGCAVLADLAAYLLFERGPIRIAYSEHAAFTSGKVVWRFDQRIDGQPWVRSAITLASPGSAFTVSPFVYFND